MPLNKDWKRCWYWWSPISLWSKQISVSMLDMLEILLWIKRNSIKSEFSKKKYKLSDYENVALYIKEKLCEK